MKLAKLPVAYQLYSARREADKDLEKVLSTLSELGYDGVEFAGFYGHDAKGINELLKKYNLKAISSHVGLDLIRADMFGVIAFHQAIGCEYIAVPYLPAEIRPGNPGFAEVLSLIHTFGRLCNEAGITLLYHNHDFEFVQFSGMYALDFLYTAVPENILKTEIDVCWVKYAGVDPAAYLTKYAGRCPVVHLKDFVGRREKDGPDPYALLGQDENRENKTQSFEFRPFGYGCQNVQEVLEAAENAGAKWLIIEQDESVGRCPLEAAKMSIDTLKKAGIKD